MSTLFSSRPLALLLLLPCGAPWPPANLRAAAPPASVAPTAAAAATDPAFQQAQAKFEILLAAGLYTRWPSGAFERAKDSPNVARVGIVGNDSHAEQYARLAVGRQFAGRQVVVHHYRSPADVEPCQILFLTSSLAKDERLALLERFKSAPVLLAGEAPGFCLEGGGLNFQVENGGVQFVLNSAVLEKKKLTIDPRFSRLARTPRPPAATTALPANALIKPNRRPGKVRPGSDTKSPPRIQPRSGEKRP
ncbi:MAG: YfiR family protein [Pirellulaceae bacterium]|nr:YfiR family protein [Pirellulaceae bacterium]